MEAQSTLIASIDKFLTTGTEILFNNIVFYVFIVVAILFTVLLKGSQFKRSEEHTSELQSQR